MQRRYHTLVVLLLTLLTLVGLLSASMSPLAEPARAQDVTSLLTPPAFENQRFVIGVHAIPDPTQDGPPTFAISDIPDPSAFPTTTVRVRNYEGLNNDQRFWLSVRIRQVDPGVQVVPEPGYAQMNLIAPGGDAEYTVTFPDTGSAKVEFEVDGSTDEAVMLTLLQFALEAGFTAAELTGLGGHDADIGLALAEVVAEQYLADLPMLTPCANAVAAVQRGLTDQEQFTRDLQGCLESPIWQSSVDQVLTRVAERDWFQQSQNAAGMVMPALGTALKAVKATQFAVQLWGMYQKFHPEIPGAMVGTVAFLSVDTTTRETLGAATAVPELSIFEVVGRAQVAIDDVGTYKFEDFVIDATGRMPKSFGEVQIAEGYKRQGRESGEVYYFVFPDGKVYAQLPDGSWEDRTPPTISPVEPLVTFLTTRGQDWTLVGVESVDGKEAYVIERTYQNHAFETHESIWIDFSMFLPIKRIEQATDPNSDTVFETVYSEFGSPVDVQVPAEALAQTPPPEPTASTVNPEDLDPEILLSLLAAIPVPDGELPTGLILIRQELMNEGTYLAPAVGGVVMGLEGDNNSLANLGLIEYHVYPSATVATEIFAAEVDSIIASDDGASIPPEFPYPALLQIFEQDDGLLGISGAQIGNVILIGRAFTESSDREQAGSIAIELTHAGVSHLTRALQEGPSNVALTPTAEPAAPLTSNEPTAIAEGLLDALLVNDFERIRQYFAPDRQPAGWGDLSHYSEIVFSGCVGVPYQTVERARINSGVEYKEFTFVFESPCGYTWDSFNADESFNTVAVSLENSTGYWYVSGGVAMFER